MCLRFATCFGGHGGGDDLYGRSDFEHHDQHRPRSSAAAKDAETAAKQRGYYWHGQPVVADQSYKAYDSTRNGVAPAAKYGYGYTYTTYAEAEETDKFGARNNNKVGSDTGYGRQVYEAADEFYQTPIKERV